MVPSTRFAAAWQSRNVLLCCCLAIILLGVHAQGSRVNDLTFFVHEDRVAGPNVTLITVVTASGDMSDVGFGTIQLFSNTLMDGPESTSGVIGVEPGFVTIGKENVFMSYVLTLTAPTYNGTLSVQGQFGFNVWPRELAVVGGTGTFRFANGYDVSEIVDDSDLADYVTVHKIHLKYVGCV